MRNVLVTTTFCSLFFSAAVCFAQPIAIVGGSVNTGYDVGSTATLRATLKGGDPNQCSVFADIEYAGSGSTSKVEMTARSGGQPGEIGYEARWPIPADATTGLYHLTFRVEDRSDQKMVATYQAPGFVAYRKLIQITRVALDKSFYAPGERIRCEVALRNLTHQDLKGLRIEFSNESYPWISTFSGEKSLSGREPVNPALGLVVLRESLDVRPEAEAILPMEPAGRAEFLQGTQVAVMGAGGPARHEKVPPPEVDRYTIAVWNHDRTQLYDMQFSHQVIVREPDRVLPKPYSRNFTHPYNKEIDYTGYREFYPPGMVSDAIRLDHSRTLYRPGDGLVLKATIPGSLSGSLHLAVKGPAGKEVFATSWTDISRSPSGLFSPESVWQIPASAAPGVYSLALSEEGAQKEKTAETATEIAVNQLPSSLLVFCPHEDDEHPWAGLMRAMVEAGLPVRVVFYTDGDVGECERYWDKPCGPNEAREFGTVRMEEAMEALEHIGVTRDHVIFLGLPDGGSGEIWFRHLHADHPFFSTYLAVDHTPQVDVYKPNLPYARDSVIGAAKEIITGFHPAMIAVSHPDERHTDHRTANWFTIKACQELLKARQINPDTVVLADQAYGAGGYKPAPYHYEKYVVHLSGEASALKQEMSWIYQSQDGNLAEGAKKTFAQLPREEIHYRITDWQQHEGWNEQ